MPALESGSLVGATGPASAARARDARVVASDAREWCEHLHSWRVNVRWRHFTRSEERKEAGDLFSESGDQSKSNRSMLLRMTIRLSIRIATSLRKGEIQVPRVADMHVLDGPRESWVASDRGS